MGNAEGSDSEIFKNNEATIVIVKPDAYRDGKDGIIMEMIQAQGFGLMGMKRLEPGPEIIGQMYSDDPNYLINIGHKEDPNLSDEDAYDFGKHMRDLNIDYMTSGPVMLLLFVGEDAVSLIRKIVGDSDPSKAEKGTIRRMSDDSFADAAKRDDTVRNLVHVPDSIENASREILLFLGNDEAFMTQLRISAPSMFGSDKAYEV